MRWEDQKNAVFSEPTQEFKRQKRETVISDGMENWGRAGSVPAGGQSAEWRSISHDARRKESGPVEKISRLFKYVWQWREGEEDSSLTLKEGLLQVSRDFTMSSRAEYAERYMRKGEDWWKQVPERAGQMRPRGQAGAWMQDEGNRHPETRESWGRSSHLLSKIPVKGERVFLRVRELKITNSREWKECLQQPQGRMVSEPKGVKQIIDCWAEQRPNKAG